MSWINSRQFTISNRNGRHYVFHRNSAGNTEINIPANIVSKIQAQAWLRAHPNKVANPTRFKPKRAAPKPGGLLPWESLSPGGRKYVKIQMGGELKRFPAPAPLKKVLVPKFYVPTPQPKPKTPPGGWKYPGPPVFNAAAWKSRATAPAFDLPCDKFKASLANFKVIGSGRQGKVYKASQRGRKEFVIKIAPYDMAAKSRGEPQPFQVEFDNQKAVMEAAPGGVVAVYKTFRCVDFVNQSDLNMKNVQNAAKYDKSRQGIIVQEYCDGGSLADWIKKNPLSDAVFKKIIKQVVGTLVEIRAKLPHFNHNDLHMENIFVSTKRGFLIGDFGWSRTRERGTNPAVNTANGTQTASFWGVGPKTDPRYDVHFFLNELREWVSRHNSSKYPLTTAFLDRVVPKGYRGASDTHVGEWRLKYNDPCPGLPTLEAVAKDPYIKGGLNTANLAAAKARLRKVGSPAAKKLEPIVLRPKRRVNSPMLRAAMARLKKLVPAKKKNYTNAELIALSAANFLKLSPKTRERAKKLRANGGGNKGKGKALPPPKNNTKKVATKTEFVLPNKGKKKVPTNILKTNKFNKLVTKIFMNRGGLAGGSNFNNAWSKARQAAINQIQVRLEANKPPFSASPPPRPKLPPPLSPLGPPKPKAPRAKTPNAPKPKAPRAKTPNAPKPKAVNFNFKLSPSSGRAKIRAPNSGRYVYANGSTISLEYLKGIAASMGVNIKGLRSKANIAKKLFG
jgi:serine/threonine protein kinase